MTGGKSLLRRVIQRAVLTGTLATAVVLAGSQLTAVDAQGVSISGPTNCDSNAVIYCGADSVSQLVGKYRGGDGRNSAASIHDIFGYFGISTADINAIGSGSTHVVPGQVTKSGDVYESGTLVATGALTGGRDYISGSTRVVRGGTTFYTRPPSVSFLDNSLSAYVVMNGGRFSFAILASCGNPIIATAKAAPPPPAPAQSQKPAPKPVLVPKPVPPPKPAPTQQPATTTTSVCSGNTTNTDNSSTNSATVQTGNCSTNVVSNTTTTTTTPPPVPTPAPPPVCEALGVNTSEGRTAAINNFQAIANGGAFTGADVNWGDGSTITGVMNPIGLNHQYQADGAYTIAVVAHFLVNGQDVAVDGPACQQQISFVTPTVTPAALTPAPAPPTPAPTVSQAVVPTTLVNTGPGNIAAIFTVSTILSALGYRYLLIRRLKV